MKIKHINKKRKIVIFKSDVLLNKKDYKEWTDRLYNNSIIFLPPWISYEVVEVDNLRFLASNSSQNSDEKGIKSQNIFTYDFELQCFLPVGVKNSEN